VTQEQIEYADYSYACLILHTPTIGVGDGGGFEGPLAPLPEINSAKFEIIRALNFGETFFEVALIL